MKKVFRTLLALVVCWCAFVEVVELFAGLTFNMRIDGDWFLIIAASSWKEMSEFFSLYGTQITYAFTAFAFLAAGILMLSFMARKWVLWGYVLAFVAYVALRIMVCKFTWPPMYLIYDTIRGTIQYAELIEAGNWDGEEGEVCADKENPNLVVVIGESMTTDRMSLYGYEKPTTPNLDALKTEMTILGPVRPNYPDTVRSIRMMFTRASAAAPGKAKETSAVSFRKKGYRPIFIGGQPKWGRYCGVEHLVFRACKTRIYTNESWVSPDEEMVDYIRREMVMYDGRPFIIFVQLCGSHYPPEHRVPPWFKSPEDFDAYDRSILYTDSVLGSLIKVIPENTTLVYVSDHGESPDSNSWRDNNSPSVWKVPLIIYPKREGVHDIDTLDQMFELLEGIADQ